MTVRQQITDDATAVFLNTDEFAEPVVYEPVQEFGEAAPSARPIDAVVIRNAYKTLSANDTYVPASKVKVANDVTNGIASTEIQLGADKISFPRRDGMDAESRTITEILTQDHAMLVLECR